MKNLNEDLRRWFKEKWTAQDGSECGDYKGKGRVKCRPSKRVSHKSPQTWGEMSGHEKKKAVKLKQKAHKKGHQFSSHSSGKTWKGDKYKHKLKKGKNKSMNESFLSFYQFLIENSTLSDDWQEWQDASERGQLPRINRDQFDTLHRSSSIEQRENLSGVKNTDAETIVGNPKEMKNLWRKYKPDYHDDYLNSLIANINNAPPPTIVRTENGEHLLGGNTRAMIMRAYHPKTPVTLRIIDLTKIENISEENKPTNPKLWSKCKSAAKRKFDVYPCVPLDSLAIGKKGPINHEDVEIGDEILTYNMNKDILEWKPVLYKHYYEKADIVEIGKPTGFSLKCTPNHKWVISRTNINNKQLIETKDINTHMKIHMCSEIENKSSLLIEGWSKKDTWIEKIISMNKNEREIYLASSVVYDGWDKGCSTKINSRHTFGFSQKEYDHLWSSLLAAYLNGYYVNINERDSITSATYIRNKKYHSTQNLYIKNSEPEDVWCPTTENQTWVMIQNGLITITGNSAYANAWAAKCYKKKRKGKGSGWKSK